MHELREQLMVVLGCADNLAFLIPPGNAERQLSDLQRAAHRALALTADIVAPTRPSTRPPSPPGW
jgi:hypothetical protein